MEKMLRIFAGFALALALSVSMAACVNDATDGEAVSQSESQGGIDKEGANTEDGWSEMARPTIKK